MQNIDKKFGITITYPYNLISYVFPTSAIDEYPPDILGSVEYALSFLSNEDRKSIHMKFRDHKSYKEIGVAIGTSVNGARRAINDALSFIRDSRAGEFIRYGVSGVIKRNVDRAMAANSSGRCFGCQNLVNDAYLSDLELSSRTYNSLRRAEYFTVCDVLDLGYDKLSKIRGIGDKSTNELILLFERLGYNCDSIKDPRKKK